MIKSVAVLSKLRIMYCAPRRIFITHNTNSPASCRCRLECVANACLSQSLLGVLLRARAQNKPCLSECCHVLGEPWDIAQGAVGAILPASWHGLHPMHFEPMQILSVCLSAEQGPPKAFSNPATSLQSDLKSECGYLATLLLQKDRYLLSTSSHPETMGR